MRTLQELCELVKTLHWTGGYISDVYIDANKQYLPYKLEFYKDLAFIVLFKEDDNDGEKVIDNCVELQCNKNNIYKIISIDGAALGTFESERLWPIQYQLIEFWRKGEMFVNEY